MTKQEREFIIKLDETIRKGAEHSARCLGLPSSEQTQHNMMPESLKLTPEERVKLEAIQTKAKERHERERKAAAQRGRKDYPLLPYECSWAYVEQFRREVRNPAPETKRRFSWLPC